METFLAEHNVVFALICGVIAVAYGAYLTSWVLKQSPGNERMREIQAAIQEGASAYLNRQYRTVAVVAVVLAAALLVLPDLGWRIALGFLIGAILSAAAGYVGMNTAVRANARTAEAGRTGLSAAFGVAFKGGTTGIDLRGVAGALVGRSDLADWRVVVGKSRRRADHELIVHVVAGEGADEADVAVAVARDVRAAAGMLPTQVVVQDAASLPDGERLTRRVLLRT